MGPAEPDLQDARDIIERQVRHLARLVDDLLDVSRITRGRITLQKERLALGVVLTNAVESSRPVIEAAGHHLTVELPPEPLHVEGDLTRLAQVFGNLLVNAAKYTDRGGRIWLTARREGSDVVVSVRDTGIGIPADHLPRLFEMFSQVAPALERSQGGLGIGLALVKGLVELHAGSVTARSDGPGHGSEFIVRLPMVIAPAARGPQPAAAAVDAPAGSRRRILIVDDNVDAARSLGMMLSLQGNEVRLAHDGLEAVEAAAKFRPEVALLDIGMPRLNGYEAAQRIRAEPWGKDMVLVALTGWGQEDDRRRSREAGFDHHLVKPVEPGELARVLAGSPPQT
jgi:CheY-like chemotaxis protein